MSGGWVRRSADGEIKQAVTSSSQYTARVTSNVGQTISDETDTALTFTTVDYDIGDLSDLGTNNTRLTAPVSGQYTITAGVLWDVSSVGDRVLKIRKGGSADEYISQHPTVTDDSKKPGQEVTAQLWLDAGDYVEAVVVQNTDAALNTSNTVESSLAMSLSQVAVIGSGPPIFTGGAVAAFIGLGTANQSIATSTITLAQCDQIGGYPTANAHPLDDDPYGMVDTANYRLIAPFSGVYMFTTTERWDGNTTGTRWAILNRNRPGTYNYGSTIMRNTRDADSIPNSTDMMSRSYFGYLDKDDWVEMYVQQDSGANRNLAASVNNPLEQWGTSGFGMALMQRTA